MDPSTIPRVHTPYLSQVTPPNSRFFAAINHCIRQFLLRCVLSFYRIKSTGSVCNAIKASSIVSYILSALLPFVSISPPVCSNVGLLFQVSYFVPPVFREYSFFFPRSNEMASVRRNFSHFLINVLSAVCNILALEEGKACVVIGTLYKQMHLKPSVLDEYSKEVREFCQSILSATYICGE